MAASDLSSRVGIKKKIIVLILVMLLFNPKPDSKTNDMSNISVLKSLEAAVRPFQPNVQFL